MNVLSLYHDLKARDVLLRADGDKLRVDAPAGELTDQDRKALVQFKSQLLKFLSRQREPEDDGCRFDAKPSRHPGYTSIYDPVHDEWHDFPTRDCYPSIVELANSKRRRGGVA